MTNSNTDPISAANHRVWLIASYRAGENTQLKALADALGWGYEIKRLEYQSYDFIPGLLRLRSLRGIKRHKSSPLKAPWPDLVISAGMRNEPICRWIQQQSGGKTRLVFLGRTWAALQHFALVITTPQYCLPQCENILHNTTTLQQVNAQQLQQAANTWAPRLSHLPEPRIAVILGGNSGPYTFGPQAARRLASMANTVAKNHDGSLLITSSARTPARSLEILTASIDCPMDCFRWKPRTDENPYYAYLALADSIIVTSDSIAMLSEACASRKPVYIFDLGQTDDFSYSAFFYRLLLRFGPQRLGRDVGLVHQRLIAEGRAVWLGEEFSTATTAPPPLQDLQHAVKRIKALFPAPT